MCFIFFRRGPWCEVHSCKNRLRKHLWAQSTRKHPRMKPCLLQFEGQRVGMQHRDRDNPIHQEDKQALRRGGVRPIHTIDNAARAMSTRCGGSVVAGPGWYGSQPGTRVGPSLGAEECCAKGRKPGRGYSSRLLSERSVKYECCMPPPTQADRQPSRSGHWRIGLGCPVRNRRRPHGCERAQSPQRGRERCTLSTGGYAPNPRPRRLLRP